MKLINMTWLKFVDELFFPRSIKICQVLTGLTQKVGVWIQFCGWDVRMSVIDTLFRITEEFFNLDFIIIYQTKYPELILIRVIIIIIWKDDLLVPLLLQIPLFHWYASQIIIK